MVVHQIGLVASDLANVSRSVFGVMVALGGEA